MPNYLKHKGYWGTVEYSSEDSLLHGKIVGINDLVIFEASSVKELEISFTDAVDDYLKTCIELDKEPNKFFKGVFNVRIPKEIHRDLAMIADKKKMKLNTLANKAFYYLVNNEEEVLNS